MNPSLLRTLFLSPQGGSKSSVHKCEHIAAITPKRYEIGCQLLLKTNRNSHTGFRLVPTSMTLNDLERRKTRIGLIVRFSPNSISLQADYATVVEDRPVMSVKLIVVEDRPVMSLKYCLPIPVFHFWPKLTHPAARSLR